MGYIGRTPTGSILTGADIADGSISTAKLADTAVSTAKIADDAVTNSKTAFNDVPFRNLIINGDMSIAQRGTQAVGGSTGLHYGGCDRLRVYQETTASAYTLSQDTNVPTAQGFAKSFKLDVTTADTSLTAGDRVDLIYRFEGQELQHIKKGTSSAESLTLSFWVSSPKTGTHIVELFDSDNTRQISKSYTVSSANTWEKKTITFEGDTSGSLNNDNNLSLQISWWLMAGSYYTSGTLSTSWSSNTNANRAVGQVNVMDSTSNNFYLTGVQLEVGTSASDFEFIPYDVNLMRCQRYYEKSYSYATAPGTNTYVGTTRFNGSTDASSNMVVCIEYATQKRTFPTQTYYTPSGTSGSWNIVRSGSSGTATANNYNHNETKLNAYFTFGASHNFANGYVEGQWTADAEL